jgi:asparagine synthase (glutamine-hydrolysing)
MCGVAGFRHLGKRPVDGAALRRMTRALAHRGPDDEGYYEAPGIALGHRRLSIIDLDSGQQPLCNEDGSVWVAFNGEIFNYLELRADLEKRGHQFRTRSDTETLVHLYEEKGLDFVDDLNGQFAIVLWDAAQRRLVLVRDRVGIRPLFHATLADGTVLFGSEMKALFAHGALRPEIDPVAVGQVASFWVSVPPRTPFMGVEELPPGRMLVLDEEGRRTQRTYWRHQFPGERDYEERSLAHWKQELQTLLHDAVRLQLRSDVPVAAYLSGGLDSSILTALVQRHHIHDLTTFSVGFADARFDERAFQEQMVHHLQTHHRSVEVTGADIGGALRDVVWYAERPMMRTAPAPLLHLSRLVRDSGIKVVLTGEGADELFGGYNIFREDKVRRFWARQPESQWRPALLSRLYPYIERDTKADAFWRMFFRAGLQDTSDPYYSHRRRWHNTSQIKRVFSPDFRAQMQGDQAMMAELEAYLEPGRERWHPLCRAQYLEMSLFMSGYLLSSQGDRVMMGNSVEGRVPYLDHRVIELAARIPPKFKIHVLEEKYILKRAFKDILPPAIATRPKHPYRSPISECLNGASDHLAASLLRPQALRQSGLANPDAVAKLMAKAAPGGVGLGERDEMALATVASLQLLNHLFVENFMSTHQERHHAPGSAATQ